MTDSIYTRTGLDGGGLRREWLNLICAKLFENNETGMFCSFGTSRLVHPNVSRDSAWTKRHYELAGKIVGKCLFESAMGNGYKTMVNGRFSRSFLAQVLGLRPNYKVNTQKPLSKSGSLADNNTLFLCQHFEQDDPELYLGKVKYVLENDVDKLELTYSEEEYTGQVVKVVTDEVQR